MSFSKSTRDSYIPKGATKFADSLSDAIAYLYTNGKGEPCAMLFVGKRAKPSYHYRYHDVGQRQANIRAAFEGRRAKVARKKAEQADRKAFVHDYKVGEILYTRWGYDQTNIDYFEIVGVAGKRLTLREVAQERTVSGWAEGQCVPLVGQYVGEPIRRLAQKNCIKVDYRLYAYRAETTKVAGMEIHSPKEWSSYA